MVDRRAVPTLRGESQDWLQMAACLRARRAGRAGGWITSPAHLPPGDRAAHPATHSRAAAAVHVGRAGNTPLTPGPGGAPPGADREHDPLESSAPWARAAAAPPTP